VASSISALSSKHRSHCALREPLIAYFECATLRAQLGGFQMSDSVYKVIEIVGTSPESWDKAAANAVERAAGNLRDLRVAEVSDQDLVIENNAVKLYRTKLKVSFKFED
jgi:flavin-binding protein dodecin